MSLIKSIIAVACLCLPGVFNASAQQSSTLLSERYYASPVSQDALRNGREYTRLSFNIHKGIPYFKTDTLSYGTVMFDGILYDSVKLLYDQVSDELITNDVSGNNLIRLVKQKVAYFTLFNTTFTYLPATGKNITAGYYEVTYDDNTQLLKKEIKEIKEEVKGDEQLKKIIQTRTRFFVKQNDEYYPVKKNKRKYKKQS